MAALKLVLLFVMAIAYSPVDAAISWAQAMPPWTPELGPVSSWSPATAPAPLGGGQSSHPPITNPSSGVKAGYWQSWTQSDFPVSEINTYYFSHVYYAFLLPDPATYEVAITPSDAQMLPVFTATLHNMTPPVKTMLSIGGGGNDPKVFSRMVSRRGSRAAFIKSAVDAIHKYDFDGVDLDWEFPSTQDDMDNLALLFGEWRAALDKAAMRARRRPYLLTAAVYYSSNLSSLGYDVSYPGQAMSEHLDWVSPMCFDYHGSWDPSETGTLAALYDPNSDLSTSYGIQSWLRVGLPPQQVVMGLPLYGITWELENPAVHGIGAPAVGMGPGGGEMDFKAVVDFNAQNNATVVYDRVTVSIYSYVGTTWIGYDDGRSITTKINYAKRFDLGGYFFWSIGMDKDWIISKQASTTWGN